MLHAFGRLAGILALLLVAACSASSHAEQPAPANRANIDVRIHSITAAPEISSFRIRETIRMTYRDAPQFDNETVITIDAVRDPVAIRTRSSHGATNILIDNQLWNRMDGNWQLSEGHGMTGNWTRNAYVELGTLSLVAPLDAQAVVDVATVVGNEKIDGRATTRFVASTADVLPLLSAHHSARLASDLTGAALDPTPPEQYLKRYDVELWVSDAGFVLKERTVIEYTEERLHGEIVGTGPVTATTTREFFDFNADIRIEHPDG